MSAIGPAAYFRAARFQKRVSFAICAMAAPMPLSSTGAVSLACRLSARSYRRSLRRQRRMAAAQFRMLRKGLQRRHPAPKRVGGIEFRDEGVIAMDRPVDRRAELQQPPGARWL